MTPAFKEWQAIVRALGTGAQSIVLRKGGIHEGRGGFQPQAAERFWLFPTRFHAQREKVKPSFGGDTTDAAAETAPVALQYVAERRAAWFVNDWAKLAAIDAFHGWTEATVRERFDWSRPPGLHVLLLRVYATDTAHALEVSPAMAGCKSWIDVPVAFPPTLRPVLDDAAFAAQATALRAALD